MTKLLNDEETNNLALYLMWLDSLKNFINPERSLNGLHSESWVENKWSEYCKDQEISLSGRDIYQNLDINILPLA